MSPSRSGRFQCQARRVEHDVIGLFHDWNQCSNGQSRRCPKNDKGFEKPKDVPPLRGQKLLIMCHQAVNYRWFKGKIAGLLGFWELLSVSCSVHVSLPNSSDEHSKLVAQFSELSPEIRNLGFLTEMKGRPLHVLVLEIIMSPIFSNVILSV
jgi:hypothetical protein